MKKFILLLTSALILGCNQPAPAPSTSPTAAAPAATATAAPSETPDPSATTAEAASDAKVSFGNLKDGDMVESPVKVVMVVEGMEVKPAGEEHPNSGHHHIIIDGEPTPKGQGVAADDTHIHFGKGQTETELTLEPGEHTLTLQFADYAHRSYGPELSNTIKITVK